MNKYPALGISAAGTLFVFIIFMLLNSSFIEDKTEVVILQRVIDGDTIELEDGRIVRLTNINAPEKNTPGANLAKEFLENYVNKSIKIEVLGKDKYYRILGRIYSPDYLNLEIVNKGYASKFLVHESELSEFADAEEIAIKNNLGIWKNSNYSKCFSVDIDQKKENVAITNDCGNLQMSGWTLKDESRKVYLFKNISVGNFVLHTGEGKDNESALFWNSKSDIWNNDRDTLYLFDREGGLAIHSSYGY